MSGDENAATNRLSSDCLKEGQVVCNGRQMMLTLTSKGLTLKECISNENQKSKGLDLEWCDIIGVTSKDKMIPDSKSFTILYMELQSKKLRRKSVDIILSTSDGADVWIENIQKQVQTVKGRPSKLFVLVNPIGGAQSGQHVYDKKVAPLFHEAGIKTHVQFTERAKHALEIAEKEDFSSYDGIVLLGGDGTYHEMIQGLTLRTQREAGVDYNDSKAILKPLTTPIAIIPTGTGNGMSGYLNGVVDVETSTLRVLRGEQHSATVYSIHSGSKLFAISGLLIGYGFFSDMIKKTSELRWMKRARYPYALMTSLVRKKREFRCELEYRLAPKKDEKDENGPSEATEQEQKLGASNEGSWVKHDSKGRSYCGVSSFIATTEQKGEQTYLNAFSDRVWLMIDLGCSTLSLFKTLMKFAMGKGITTLPTNVDLIKELQGFRLRLVRDPVESGASVSSSEAKARELEYYINVDGESQVLETPQIEVNLIPSFVPVYGTRMGDLIEDAQQKEH